MNSVMKVTVVGMLLLFASGCSTPPKAVVSEHRVYTEREQIEPFGGQLIRFAQPGDTMHGIAFAAGVDVNLLAAWNNKRDTSKLAVGERIRLTAPLGFKPSVQKPRATTKPSSAAGNNTQVSRKARRPSAQPQQPSTKPNANTLVSNRPVSQTKWTWPLRGQLISRFNPRSGKQGIDIGASIGSTVKASSAGEIVYSGNSLKGYGHLIIVKHSDEFLSAYAHTHKVVVKEGQRVASGQMLAKVGLNNRGQAALQFQIRKNGTPVDPLRFLP